MRSATLAIARLSSARRRRGVEVRGASSQRWLCRVPLGGVGVVRCVSPTAASGTSHPRARLVRPCSSPKLPLRVPSGAGRGLKVCSSCRRCVLRAFHGFPARSGAARSAKPPKTERGGSVPNEFAPNLPRSVFRLRRASPPPLGHCPSGARRAVARVSGVARGGDAEAGILKVPRRTNQQTASASRGPLRAASPLPSATRISPRFRAFFFLGGGGA